MLQEEPTPEFPGYSPAERAIFAYFDGVANVHGDPVAIRRRLEAHLGNVDRVLGFCHAADWPGTGESPPDWVPADEAVKAAASAKGQLVEAVRDAFRMQPFDATTGIGALEDDCWGALNAYEAFLTSQKKSGLTG